MQRYRIWYIEGPNLDLKKSRERVVEADSFAEALRPYTNWPVVENYDHTTASAWNPGTCMYYQELWEAKLLQGADEG
ncbi:MAG: hypothetical protein LBR22_04405 [Desulfovibrio sp.]|jgi:hypothetical protein|nr:hypothetical protein [Desulfovibrio sp.]